MAVKSQPQAVKCLNTSSGRRRFVFKTFSQRVEEIEIDVFRNLEPVRSEPKDGSSFFLEALLYWRELNTAEDFILFYEEMRPLVQTLPQILLHKDKIFSELVGRIHMGAKLSLEPMLMLIAAFSRDILEEFLPFLQRLSNSLKDLLLNGGDHDSEVLEKVFTSWSYLIMYLQKYLIKDVVTFLKITIRLRYYPKDYVQEFMAESVSFLLRNSPFNQLENGIRKIILEVTKGSASVRKTGAMALIWHVIRGTSLRLHSRASEVLLLLMDESILGMRDSPQGSEAALEVTLDILNRLWEETQNQERNVIYKCLYEIIPVAICRGCLGHLGQLLTLLITAVHLTKSDKVFDGYEMLKLVRLLIQSYIASADTVQSEDHPSEDPESIAVIREKIMQLVLRLLDKPQFYSDIRGLAIEFYPLFKLERSSLLIFVKELVLKEPEVVHAFRPYIISTMDELIGDLPDEALFWMRTVVERKDCNILDGVPEECAFNICKFFNETISYWVKLSSDIAIIGNITNLQSRLAILWGVVNCYPYFLHAKENVIQVKSLIRNLDQLLEANLDSFAGVSMYVWQDVLGAILVSYHKLILQIDMGHLEAHYFVSLAKRHKSCPRILSAVAEYLDSILRPQNEAHGYQVTFPEPVFEDVENSIGIFADNLSLPNKEIRVLTLRILSHYPILDDPHMIEEPPHKKLKYDESDSAQDCQVFNVVNLLLSIETTPVSVSTSRKIVILISRLQMATSGKINDFYVPIVLNGIIGILQNRFSLLWEPALECLTTLIGRYKGICWNQFFQHLEFYQLKFLSTDATSLKLKSEHSQPKTLLQCFNIYVTEDFDSTPCKTVTSLLLQALQKVPDIAESCSRQLISLFLKFLGYTDDEKLSADSFKENVGNGKEQRSILKDWLDLLKTMRNSRSLYQSQFVKDVLVKRLLDQIDPDIQLKVIDCLLNWKDDFLIPYDQHLKNLVLAKNLREELTTWSISKDSKYIQEGHRAKLVPIIVRLLTPKVRKLKHVASRKHAGVNNRRAILCFLTQLDIDELHLFFCLLLKPLNVNLYETDVVDGHSYGLCHKFADKSRSLGPTKCSTSQAVANLSWKRKYGFLYVLEDILKTFDAFHIRPFLSPLMMIVTLMLENCTSNIQKEVDSKLCASGYGCTGDTAISAQSSLMTRTSIKQFKDFRSPCLRVLSLALSKHDNFDFGCEFWDTFFRSVKPLTDSFKEEGSSCEKPSSLFACFLAMSQSPKLVSFLNKEANLVPTIFSILTVRTASDAIISSVLNFVENLLDLDSYSDHQDVASKKMVFYPHLEVLIHSFHEFFQSRRDAHRKSNTWPGKMELRIFKMIMKYINNPLTAAQFLDILLPLFKKKGLDDDDCLEALHVLKGILKYVNDDGDETSAKILKAIHPLLVTAGLDVKQCICDIINSLSIIDPSLTHVAKMLHDLNAVSSSDIGELDYDTIVGAYETIRPEVFSSLGSDHSLPILSNCIFHLSSDELILRQCSSKSLLAFVQFAASYLKMNAERHVSNWTKDRVLGIIKSVFLKNMEEAMTKDTSIQKEWIILLREMVYNLHEVSALCSFRPLCSEDPEVDFFNNIFHLQVHRRRKALLRFRNVISAGNFPENICVKIFVPLFWSMMLDVKAGKGEHLRDACLDTLASISSQLRWEPYRSFLTRCFHEITVHPDKQKILVRLLCAVLDMFHFSALSSCDNGKVDLEVLNTEDTSENSSMALRGSSSATNFRPDIQIYLQNKVLPQIQRLLTSDSEKVNVIISLAAIKLLKLLPADTMNSQLSSIIHHICNFLKNRLESVRDEARSALAECTKELGLEYLQFIVKVLRANLKKGYEMHVLGYSLNFILSKTLTEKTTGSLDYCLEELLSIVENDIFGDVAEEKEVEKIASKMKENRKTKSFDTLKLISQSITFAKHAMKLLSPVCAQLAKHLTPKIKRKLEMMLFHIATGIECNPSAETAELFIFSYGLVEDSIGNEPTHGKENSETAINLKSSLTVVDKGKYPCSSNRGLKDSHLISVFALGLLHDRLKNMKLDKNDQQLLSMLDPFVKQLGECLDSKYEDVLSSTLRCLAQLIKLPLPSLGAQANKIKIFLLLIAQRSGNGSSLLLQSCLKLLTVLLQSARISLSHSELHMLIQFPVFVDIQTCPSPIAFSLLKAIIGQKLLVHEIFDIILKVAELMVTSQSEPIRKKCSQILLQFLLHYNLPEKRMQQHMNFLLTNLSYEHTSGREAVLEMLHTILIKFPKSVIDNNAHTIFLHLVVALANEHDQKVQSMISAVLKELIDRTSQQMLQMILEYSLTWYFGEKQYLWGAAAQVIGLLIEVLKKVFKNRISSTLQVAKKILKYSIDAVDFNKAGFLNEPEVPFWKEAYYTVLMLEKMLFQFPELYFQVIFEEIWGIIGKLLLHPHIWLRNISSRLVALYFATVSQRSEIENMDLYLKPSKLFAIAISFLSQLESQKIDITNSNIITQNLAFSICFLHAYAKQNRPTPFHKFWSMLDANEHSSYLESFNLLGSTKAKRIFLLSTSFTSHSSEVDGFAIDNEDLQSLLVVPLFKRLGKIAMMKEDDQMKIIFNCLRMISSQIGTEGSQEYAIYMLIPLFKVCEEFAGKVITDEIKQLAEEVRDSIRKVLGVDHFIRIHNEIRKKLKVKRDRRKQQQKLIAAINPMLHAKRKLRISAKHRAHKRRKIEAMKMGRKRTR